MLLTDLFDPELADEMLDAGMVSQREHPELPLRILNYTAQCQYERAWNDVTRQCRGLIYDYETGEVIARPFPKFFNYGEHEEGSLDLDAPANVYDKLDGSLGILYEYRGRIEIATRGSFTSEQAVWATKFYRDSYGYPPMGGWTYLFEVIYPGNRIVVDYGGREMLVALGMVNIRTGLTLGPPTNWPGPRAEALPASTLREALALPPRKNAEGVVVVYPGNARYPAPSLMVKLKQDDYVELHRIVTGMSPRAVWERLGAGEKTEDIVAGLPEEFAAWVRDIAAKLLAQYGAEYEATQRAFTKIDALLRSGDPESEALQVITGERSYSRKEFAAEATKTDRASWLFMLLDGKDVRPAIWATLKPKGDDARSEEGSEEGTE